MNVKRARKLLLRVAGDDDSLRRIRTGICVRLQKNERWKEVYFRPSILRADDIDPTSRLNDALTYLVAGGRQSRLLSVS